MSEAEKILEELKEELEKRLEEAKAEDEKPDRSFFERSVTAGVIGVYVGLLGFIKKKESEDKPFWRNKERTYMRDEIGDDWLLNILICLEEGRYDRSFVTPEVIERIFDEAKERGLIPEREFDDTLADAVGLWYDIKDWEGLSEDAECLEGEQR